MILTKKSKYQEVLPMGNSITQKMKYKQSVIKFSYKYGVTKAAIKFGENRRTIYRWRDKYDGTLESLKDKSRRPHSHPNEHTKEEIELIRKYKAQAQAFQISELKKLIQQLEDLDYKYKIGLIDLNIGLEAIICAI